MPHHFKFDAEHRILLIVMEGDIDGREVLAIDREMRAAIAQTQPTAGISDLSAVRSFNVPSQIIRSAAIQDPAPFPASTPRFIVAPTDFLFGMMRMYELVANRPQGILKVVRSMEGALASLGVCAARFEMLE